jgi:hypothetical protein
MRRIFALCAVAGIGFTALAASSPAQAAFHLIRWQIPAFARSGTRTFRLRRIPGITP